MRVDLAVHANFVREMSCACLFGDLTSPDHPITRSPDHPITRSPDHPITRSPDHPITRSPDSLLHARATKNLYISSLMLDLNFVREHLPQVEERLRQRGLNADELLGGFRDLDARRRQAITAAETLKAERNKKSEEVGRRKRAGEDAGALM